MTKAEKHHLSKVAALGCIACWLKGFQGTPCEIHHPRAGVGKGQKASHYEAIGLCPAHHRGTDHPRTASIHLDRLEFINQFGTEAELLSKTRELLGVQQ